MLASETPRVCELWCENNDLLLFLVGRGLDQEKVLQPSPDSKVRPFFRS
jgi:hypothetical protein